jgi:SAM-dependent methyltransferase
MVHETDPLRRFSNRVSDYDRFRPRYPAALIDTLRDLAGLTPRDVVADVGSGTGILTRLLLDSGHRVFAVEPNAAMRAVAERDFSDNARFTSVDGAAERTTLPDGSVDVVTAAQAFHWFDRDACRREFTRILRGQSDVTPRARGNVALVWNTRRTDGNAFMRDYERLLVECAIDYTAVDHRHVDEAALAAFFVDYERAVIPFEEALDWEATRGRMASASYVPSPENAGYADIVAGLREAFERHARDGRVVWTYDSEVTVGRVS